MFKQVHFEISGVCNAKCPWCSNGGVHLKSHPSRFIPPVEFRAAINRLFDESLINNKTVIRLFNYGEPILHPQLPELLKILVQNDLGYIISTNASKYIPLDKDLLNNLQHFMISMPGFSQKSYDRVHGFQFNEILNNIDRWTELVGSEKILIKFHVYQFNLDEIEAASTYFKKRNVKFFPYFALIADYKMAHAYLTHTMPRDVLEKASRDLMLFYVDELISSAPENFQCPEWHSKLTIDEYCNILTCCTLSKGGFRKTPFLFAVLIKTSS
jgi:MoaA/NifB/PqqE/SkfB family radical SAM enzyme